MMFTVAMMANTNISSKNQTMIHCPFENLNKEHIFFFLKWAMVKVTKLKKVNLFLLQQEIETEERAKGQV